MVVTWLTPESQYAANKDLKKEDVEQLQEWVKMQPHLPPIVEVALQLFLHACYYKNEAAKRTIDNFYTTRGHCPEFFGNRDPKRPKFQATMNSFVVAPLKVLSPEGYGLVYMRLVDFNSDLYCFDDHINMMDMRISLWMKEAGCLEGHAMILDMYGSTFGHLTKVGLLSLKKFLYYVQEAIPLRLKVLHFVNPPTFMDRVISMIKPFLNPELFNLLHIHTTLEHLHKEIPRHCLPQEVGGTGPTVMELHKENVRILNENAEELISEETHIVDETKRPGKPKNSSDFFGVEGTFKKLDID